MSPKWFLASKTFIFAILWGVFGILRATGKLHIDDAVADEIIGFVANVLGVGSVTWARAVAQGPLTLTKQ